MAEYAYAADGKIHTRYSELMRCTAGQIDRVVWERQYPDARRETEHMSFGSLRHEMLEEEARASGQLPACFGIKAPADYIEHEFTSEITSGIIVHSRPDVVSTKLQTVFDYKTVVDGAAGWKHNVDSYRGATKQRQLIFYAFQMGLHNIPIKHGAFLCEVWNPERDTIIGYQIVRFDISYRQLLEAASWAKDRAAMLAVVLEEAAAGL